MFHYRAIGAAWLLACCVNPAYADHPSAGFGAEGTGPITTIQAATLPQGALIFGSSGEYIKSDTFSDAELIEKAGNHIHAHSAGRLFVSSLGIGYGLTGDLSISVLVPYVYRENIRAGKHSHGGGPVNSVENHGDSGGHADISALGKYRFWRQQNNQASMLFGVKAPTGRTDLRDGGEKLEAEHQPGSGSWDGLFGMAAGKPGPARFFWTLTCSTRWRPKDRRTPILATGWHTIWPHLTGSAAILMITATGASATRHGI